MILIIHKNSDLLVEVLIDGIAKRYDGSLIQVFWQVALEFPEELIIWCEQDFKDFLEYSSIPEIFYNDLIMSSYAIENLFIPKKIGFIDQLPFVQINRTVKYPTWLMSSDVGGLKAKTLLKFKSHFKGVSNFDFLINSIAKTGQENGLFCYSDPGLLKNEFFSKNTISQYLPKSKASNEALFSFVARHFHRKRSILLFWCVFKYERNFPLIPFLKAIFHSRNTTHKLDFEPGLGAFKSENTSVDVIIPSLGRPEYLKQFLEDLASQTYLPRKVIVVEQDPNTNSSSSLTEINSKSWPFNLKHHFTHRTGACYARNLALDETNAEYVFFADDDNRIDKNFLKESLIEIQKYKLDCLSFFYPQPKEKQVFGKLKQWGTFGAGNSLVSGKYASKVRFDERFEYGYGEDKDYGMQLRNLGCDIIYHPNIKILHLKAPRGGFRNDNGIPWKKDNPKPSPTLLLYYKKHLSLQQLQGFKEELFSRFYFRQDIKNPISYLYMMKRRWRSSEDWMEKLKAKKVNHFKEGQVL